jgi:hypothetical protein
LKEKIGAKQKLIIIVVAIVVPLAMLTAVCVKLYYREFRPTPNYWKEVELEIIDPTTGLVIEDGDTIDLPKENTPIEIKVRDKETGRYLTDEDFPGTTIKESLIIHFSLAEEGGGGPMHMIRVSTWPSKSYLDKWPEINYYQIWPDFTPKDQVIKKNKERYNGNHDTRICIYINTSFSDNK